MKATDIIVKKRDHQELSKDEIRFFIQGLSDGTIPDYQVSAWAMAVLLNGMTDQETTDLTKSMADSGEILDLSDIAPIVVDKHSTGGVGDKTTLVVAPLVAACGLPVGKMSGRGLGFSGGTLDKLESVPGYRVNLSQEEFRKQLRDLGIVVTGQTTDLAPADGKLYALRDVTGTVPSLPLIASSIMSKKIAGGAHAIVLDVKTGNGAFMTNIEDAKKLAQIMVTIGTMSDRKVIGVISDMNQPLGNAVGNALELQEAIYTMHGEGPADFLEHCIVISSYMLVLGKKAKDIAAARSLAEETLASGAAWEKFSQLIKQQGGDLSYIDNPEKLVDASVRIDILAERNGFVSEIHARTIGETAVDLGAGRVKKTDPIDPSAGIIVHKNVGDAVEKDEPIYTVYANSQASATAAKERLESSFTWSQDPCEPLPLFYGTIS